MVLAVQVVKTILVVLVVRCGRASWKRWSRWLPGPRWQRWRSMAAMAIERWQVSIGRVGGVWWLLRSRIARRCRCGGDRWQRWRSRIARLCRCGGERCFRWFRQWRSRIARLCRCGGERCVRGRTAGRDGLDGSRYATSAATAANPPGAWGGVWRTTLLPNRGVSPTRRSSHTRLPHSRPSVPHAPPGTSGARGGQRPCAGIAATTTTTTHWRGCCLSLASQDATRIGITTHCFDACFFGWPQRQPR